MSWETSKENTRPLRTGYSAAMLSDSNLPSPEELQAQKRELEALVMASGGSDPIAPWLQYIEWTEERVRKSDFAVDLTDLLERCMRRLMSFKEARADERFLPICLKYVDTCNDPISIMTALYNKSVCIMFPRFWKSWATYYELAGKPDEAVATLETGMRTLLDDFDRATLGDALANLQVRIADGYPNHGGVTDDEQEIGLVEENPRKMARGSLMELPRTKHGKVPVNRAALSRAPRALKGTGEPGTSGAGNAQLSIFADTAAAKLTVPSHSAPNERLWRGVPTKTVTTKENHKAATTWTGGIGGREGIADAALNVFSEKTNVDAGQQTKKATRSGKPTIKKKALQAKKAPVRKGVCHDYARERGFNQRFQDKGKNCFMRYTPAAMYPTLDAEYSFEELQAQRWLAQRGITMGDFPVQHTMADELQMRSAPASLAPSDTAGNSHYDAQEEEGEAVKPQQFASDHIDTAPTSVPQEAQRKPLAQKFVLFPREDDVDEEQRPLQQRGEEDQHHPDSFKSPDDSKVVRPSKAPFTGQTIFNPDDNDEDTLGDNTVTKQLHFSNITQTTNASHYHMSPTINTKAALADIQSMFRDDDGEEENAAVHGAMTSKAAAVATASKPLSIFSEDDPSTDNSIAPSAFVVHDENARPTAQQQQQPNQMLVKRPTEKRQALGVLSTFEVFSDDEKGTDHQEPNETGGNFTTTEGRPSEEGQRGFTHEHEAQHAQKYSLSPILEQSREGYSSSMSSSSTASSTHGAMRTPSANHALATSQEQQRRLYGLSTIKKPTMVSEDVIPEEEDEQSLQDQQEQGQSQEHCTDAEVTAAIEEPHHDDAKPQNEDGSSLISHDQQQHQQQQRSATAAMSSVEYHEFIAEKCMDEIKNAPNCVKINSAAFQFSVGQALPHILPGSKFHVWKDAGAGSFYALEIGEDEDEDDLDDEDAEYLQCVLLETKGSSSEIRLKCLLQERLAAMTDKELQVRGADSLSLPVAMCSFTDAVVIASKASVKPTFKELVAMYGANKKTMNETLVMFYTIELLRTVQALHAAGIVHGSISLGNLRVRSDMYMMEGDLEDAYNSKGLNYWEQQGLLLSDFSAAVPVDEVPVIDFSAIPLMQQMGIQSGTLECDYAAVAGVAHALLFGSEMRVTAAEDGATIQIEEQIKGFWQRDLWETFFHVLLNSKASEGPADLRAIRRQFENYLESSTAKAESVSTLLTRQNVSMMI